METNLNLLALLHDTCLKEVKRVDKGFHFYFAFYLNGTNEHKVELITNETANISCVEYYRDNTQIEINLTDLQNVDCIKAEQKNNNIELFLEDIEKDTVIKLHFEAQKKQFTGEIEQLKQFWND